MCGIVGIRLKDRAAASRLGELVVPMLELLAGRGPDSTGLAIYVPQRDAGDGLKLTVCSPSSSYPWDRLERALARADPGMSILRTRGRLAVLLTGRDPQDAIDAITGADEALQVFGWGRDIELIKDVGAADEICRRYDVRSMHGYQAIGHTRMATESAVTIAHSHPFAVGTDLALVHNGSFSNYASIRRTLAQRGVVCSTDNDSEVAARFITHRIDQGDDLEEALAHVLKTFDGFFTLLVSTSSELAVLRDSFSCKPLVVAETDEFVAVASEYVALAHLPGIETATVFEPQPEEVYTWSS